MDADLEKTVKKLTDQFTKEGKLIEAGWVSLRLMTLPQDAPQIQIDEMRNAFFAGAQHLFGSLMTILDPGTEEITAADLAKMDLIHRELNVFIADYQKKHGLVRTVM